MDDEHAGGASRPVAAQPASTGFQATVRFRTPRTVVFEALTTLEGLAAWWSPVTGSPEAGGELRFDHQRSETLIIEVDEVSHPDRVRWRVVAYELNPEWSGTEIVFVLDEDEPTGTHLAFEHRGLVPDLECFESCRAGWDHFLDSLRSHVDHGAGSPLTS